MVGNSRLIGFCLNPGDLGVGTHIVIPPALGITWLVFDAIARSLFLLDQDVVIDALGAPLGG